MELTVLMDDNILHNTYLRAEHGLSYLLESRKNKILFDAGYSELFLYNADKLNKEITDIDHLILSHGHLDHSWGLEALSRRFVEKKIGGEDFKKPNLIAHPHFAIPKHYQGAQIGIHLSDGFLESIFDFGLSAEPKWIEDDLLFLGDIPRRFDFEKGSPIGSIETEQGLEDDHISDDTAVVYTGGENGIVVITGCSHSGICNIVEQAKELSGRGDIHAVIGGFHLQDPGQERLDKTAEYMLKNEVDLIYPAHCTDLKSKIALAQKLNVKEVGVGLKLDF
ncbi:MAG: MBL fold metallo-hydrolase [Halanaerobiales bacterium]|nr:MBL fold metallo-hydrolase [Halanaerobiales bacterium]